MLSQTSLRVLLAPALALLVANAYCQDSAWVYGSLYLGAQQVRTAQTFQNSNATRSETTKTAATINGEITFDYSVPKWTFSTGLGYSKTSFAYNNFTPGGTNNRRTKQTLDTSTPYFVFIPRYRAGESFSIGPRTEVHYGSNAFHSEAKKNEGTILAYVGLDASFEYKFDELLMRTGFIGCVDLNETKRTVIYAAIYAGFGWNLFSNEAPDKVSMEKRPIIKASAGEIIARNYESNSLRKPILETASDKTLILKIPSIDFLFSPEPPEPETILPTGLRYLEEVGLNLAKFERSWSEARITGINYNIGNSKQLYQQARRWSEDVKRVLAKASVPTFKTSTGAKVQIGSARYVEIRIKASSEEGQLTLLGVLKGLHRRMGYR